MHIHLKPLFFFSIGCLGLAGVILLILIIYGWFVKPKPIVWSHPNASINYQQLPGVDINFKEVINASGRFETYTFTDTKGVELFYLELQLVKDAPAAVTSQSENLSTDPSLVYNPFETAAPIREGKYLGKLLEAEAYVIPESSDFFDTYKGVLMFKQGEEYINTEGQTEKHAYISGRLHMDLSDADYKEISKILSQLSLR